jgi:flagellar hook-basal body complex protein FliE
MEAITSVRPYDVNPAELYKPIEVERDIVPYDNTAINPFDSFFNAAMDALEETNGYQLTADKWQQDLATGQTTDILAVLLAQDKAYSTLNFTVQVTNKIIESYREVMRMQI